MRVGQVAALAVALAGVIGMGYASSVGQAAAGDTLVGLLGAAACVVGWGSEAVLCAWGMRDDAVDNETALQIRETTSALVYGIVVLPLFGAWGFVSSAFPSAGTAIVAASALAGAASYLFYYKGSPSSGRRAAWRSTSPIRRGRWSSACFCWARCRRLSTSSAASPSCAAPCWRRRIGASFSGGEGLSSGASRGCAKLVLVFDGVSIRMEGAR